MSLSNLVIGVVAVIALVLGGIAVSTPNPVVETPKPGAAGLSVNGNCVEIGAGGGKLCSYRQVMKSATTTCSIRPGLDMASSTLIKSSVRVTNNYGGTIELEFGKSTSAFATTTSLGTGSLAAGGVLQASSSPLTGLNLASNFSANEFLNVKIASTSPTVNGECNAVFMGI